MHFCICWVLDVLSSDQSHFRVVAREDVLLVKYLKKEIFSVCLSGLTENSGSAIVKVYAFRQNGQEFSSINFFSSELASSSKEKHLQEIYFICSWWARISTWDVTILLPAFKILIISSFFYLFIELIGESGVFPWIFAVNISVVHEKGRKYVQ